jgi:dTDP-4-amino-4,6-dideoxygalactose transaminase
MGIETRPVLTGNFLAQPSLVNLGNHFPHPSEFVNASKISESAFMVGAHHDFTSEQIDYLAKSLKQIATETV